MAFAVAVVCVTAVFAATPPVYLNDPGLIGLAERPEYITPPQTGQTFEWVTRIRWSSWGGPTAQGTGTWERCTFGRCKRAKARVILSRLVPKGCSTGSSYTRITFVTTAGARTMAAPAYVCESD
jgi:hypothetical protein